MRNKKSINWLNLKGNKNYTAILIRVTRIKGDLRSSSKILERINRFIRKESKKYQIKGDKDRPGVRNKKIILEFKFWLIVNNQAISLPWTKNKNLRFYIEKSGGKRKPKYLPESRKYRKKTAR